MKEKEHVDVSKKEQKYCSMMRDSFKVAVKDREKSKAILEKAAQLKEEIKVLKDQSN